MTTVLFTRSDSVYLSLGCDCWGMERDARLYRGDDPVIAHPPCRAWGRLRDFAKPRHDEKDLARFAIAVIRKNEGVLEHPGSSTLWADQGIPKPGQREVDEWGGYSISVDQFWWGHRCEKRTWLYIVGVELRDLPAHPLNFNAVTHRVTSRSRNRKGMQGWKPEIGKAEREATPVEFAKYLISIVELIKSKK
jgi:hypothetical protein